MLVTLTGLILGYGAVAAISVALADIARISQAEGVYVMSVFFGWAPMGAALGAIAGFLLTRPRDPSTAPDQPLPDTSSPPS